MSQNYQLAVLVFQLVRKLDNLGIEVEVWRIELEGVQSNAQLSKKEEIYIVKMFF
jgi:hypothetical protein